MMTPTASTKPRGLITTAIFAALALSCAAVSVAGDADDVPQAVVKFGDLNLSSAGGAAALYRRIYAAAHDVCGSFDNDMRDLPEVRGRDTCVHGVVRDAVARVNQPALSAIYNARNRDPLPITVAAAQNR